MKKAAKFNYERKDMPAEIDFSGGQRGRYLDRFAEGTNLIPLAPDVVQLFPDAESVNSALRLLGKVAERSKLAQR